MPKVKSHSATAKRVKVTGTGRFKHKRNGMRHNLRKKETAQKRRLNVDAMVGPTNDGAVRRALHLPNPKPRRTEKAADTPSE
ncbi:MAG: 50S ribosomal protein L35 [Bacteroidia bacterium]|nr:50S ribosomal protein L35 [Bacteroidia bacterium]